MSPLAENSGSTVVAAVIGLGSMGLGMALSMKRAGLDVVGYDVTPAAVDRFVDEGGRGASTPAAAAKDADIVVSVVVNGAQTRPCCSGLRCRACDEARCRLHLIGNHGSSRRARSGRAGGSSRPALSRRADFGRRGQGGAWRTDDHGIRFQTGLRYGTLGSRRHGRQGLRAWRRGRKRRRLQDDQPASRRRAHRGRL